MPLYNVKGLPWSNGIGTNVSDCKTAREVMEKAKLDFFVKKCELVARMPFDINANNLLMHDDFARDGNIYRTCPNAFATYRTDINIPLGIVKERYEVVQNIEVFNFFDSVIGEGMAQWCYAGQLGYGHKIYVVAKVPVSTKVGGDPVDHYLVFSNTHDGSGSVDIMFTPVRVFCSNCLNAALKSADSHIRLKHTKSVGQRIQEGAEVLHVACEYANTATELYDALNHIKVDDKQVMDYIAALVLSESELNSVNFVDDTNGVKKLFYRDYLIMEKTGISSRKANMMSTMFDYYQNGVAQRPIVGTAWGAYNAITGYYSNVSNNEGQKRLDTLVWGSANNTMQKALVSAIELAEAV